MKFQSFLDKVYKSGENDIHIIRSMSTLSKKHGERLCDTITLVVGGSRYCFIKHDSDEWVRWAEHITSKVDDK